MALKVLMFGWEFPPHNSGGLGTACLGLTKALVEADTEITFVLPKRLPVTASHAKLVFAEVEGMSALAVNSLLSPYLTSEQYESVRQGLGHNYGQTLFDEVILYGQKAGQIAQDNKHDVIHAHDWLSFPAGIAAKKASGKPLVVHVHATEFDRTGGGSINPEVYQIEKKGMEVADKVLAVSERTKQMIVDHYSVPPDKIQVVYNGVEMNPAPKLLPKLQSLKKAGNKIVLFVGRVTLQKGPDYFLELAAKVLEYRRDVYFIVAGSGDMERQIIQDAAGRGITDRVIFAGFVRGAELDGLYQMADMYVLPSVSEPFGIAPLEALALGTPVLISKQSGVAEVLNHALKADFWDIEAMADKILAALQYESLPQTLVKHGREEVKRLTWAAAAKKCIDVYQDLVANRAYA